MFDYDISAVFFYMHTSLSQFSSQISLRHEASRKITLGTLKVITLIYVYRGPPLASSEQYNQ